MLSFGYTPIKKDYIKSFQTISLRYWYQWAIMLVLTIPPTICIFSAISRGEFGNDFSSIFPGLFFLILFFYIVFSFINPYLQANRIGKNERLISPVNYEAYEDHILIRNKFGESKMDWGTFQKYIDTKDLFLLIYSTNKNMFQLIPKRAFSSEEDEESFRKLLISKGLKRITSPFIK
jgi:hypothetical protein